MGRGGEGDGEGMMFAKADTALLRAYDRALLWLWDEWGVTWRQAMRAEAALWVATFGARAVQSERPRETVVCIGLSVAVALAELMMEWSRGHRTDREQAAIAAVTREMPILRGCRFVACAVALLLLALNHDVVGVASALLLAGRGYLASAFIPLGPRNPRRSPVLAHAAGRA